MLITRETDYSMRILRALARGERRSVKEISEQQMIPMQFAYKIAKKLEKAGIIAITRGATGGCSLLADLHQVTLYDLMATMEEKGMVISCMSPDYPCPWREANGGCVVHCELGKVQEKLDRELKSNYLYDLIFGTEN